MVSKPPQAQAGTGIRKETRYHDAGGRVLFVHEYLNPMGGQSQYWMQLLIPRPMGPGGSLMQNLERHELKGIQSIEEAFAQFDEQALACFEKIKQESSPIQIAGANQIPPILDINRNGHNKRI